MKRWRNPIYIRWDEPILYPNTSHYTERLPGDDYTPRLEWLSLADTRLVMGLLEMVSSKNILFKFDIPGLSFRTLQRMEIFFSFKIKIEN